MDIDLENIDQSQIFFDENIFYPTYKKLEGASSLRRIYLMAPLVAVTDGFLNLVESICGVSEATFKGLANIFGTCFSGKCNSYRGALQLAGAVAIGTLAPFVIASRMIKVGYQFFKDPLLYSSNQIQKYQPLLKHS